MKLFSRHFQPSNVMIVAIGVLVAALAFLSYLDKRSELAADRDARQRDLDSAHASLQREAELTQFMAGPGAVMTADSSDVEGRVLHLVRDWEEQTNVGNRAFGRTAVTVEHGFTRLAFQISASGSMEAVAGLLYRVEKSPVPLRVDGALVRPVGDKSDQVEIHLNVSALSANGAQKAKTPLPVAEAQ